MDDVLERFPAAGVRGSGVYARAWRNAFPFIVVGAVWEAVAHLGIFPVQFFPPLEAIAAAFARLTASGVLPHHAIDTLIRLTVGSRSPHAPASRRVCSWGVRVGQ